MQAARGASLSPSDDTNPRVHPRRRRRHLWLFGAIAATAYALDVTTKILAVEHLRGEPRMPLVGDFLSLYLTYNSGAAFSFLTGHTEVLTVVAMIATLVVLWVARRLGSTGWAIALGFLLGGVLGNLTDRLVREPGFMQGHVVDFFMLPNFPVFNVADICINIAAGTIILQALRGINVDGSRHVNHPSDDRPDGAGGAPVS
ncbi:MAG TPA: signal peptidase II [Nocardioidaceae bacterium]|nr:signal peptidase II [Nocardioidaceae bacterium]